MHIQQRILRGQLRTAGIGANTFIGNYLRLDILTHLDYLDTVRENIEGYFLYMADKTGTLWEQIGDTASCNHSFPSYVLYWLDKIENKG